MAVKRRIPFNEGIFFITMTCYRWISLIDLANGYDIVYNWFDHLQELGHYIIGYIIMPNHIHSLIAFTNNGKNINTEIGEGKRFMAYEVIRRLKNMRMMNILLQLEQGVNRSDERRGKKHEIWNASFDWKECHDSRLINQKLDYIHKNCCVGKWNLVKSPVDYTHSSAYYYLTGEQGLYPITHYLKLEDINLTKPFFR